MQKILNLFNKSLAVAISTTLAIAISHSVFMPITAYAAEIEEVLIYGRKKEESLQEAPIVVNVFAEENIDRYRLQTMEDVSQFTPGLVIGEVVTAAGPNIYLRGIGSPAASASAPQSVSFVVDGVAINHGIIARTAQIDLQQVEVLKGPQTLFFGKSSSGGILNYVTNNPTDKFEMILKGGFEFEADETYGEFIVSGPISDSLKGRLVARYSKADGYLDISAAPNTLLDAVPGFAGNAPGSTDSNGPNFDRRFIRGTLLWDPSDSISMRTKVHYDDSDNSGAIVTQYSSCIQGSSSLVLDFIDQADDCVIDEFAPVQAPSAAAAAYLGVPAENFGENDQTFFSHEMKFDLTEELEFTSVTGYFEANDFTVNQFAQGVTAGFNTAAVTNNQETLSQELRIASAYDGPVNFTAGVYWSDGTFESITAVFAPGMLPLRPFRQVDTDSLSAFAQLSYDISNTVNLSVGGRYSKEEKDYQANDDGRDLVFLNPENNNRDFSDFSPEVTLTWQASDSVNMFASYKEGFKSGGYNVTLIPLFDSVAAAGIGLSESTTSFNQETAEGFEIGLKSDLLDNRLRFNAAVWRYEYNELQAVIFQPATRSLIYRNAGELVTQGFEADVTYLPEVEGLRLTASLAYVDSEYTSEFLFQCYSNQPASECFDRGNGAPEQDFNGQPPILAPELETNLGLVYEFAVSDNLNLELNALAAYTDEFFAQAEHDPRSLQDSTWKINAGATLRSADEKWSLSLIGRNLTDELTCATVGAVTSDTAMPQDLACTLQRPRQMWIEGQYNF